MHFLGFFLHLFSKHGLGLMVVEEIDALDFRRIHIFLFLCVQVTEWIRNPRQKSVVRDYNLLLLRLCDFL
jgi:hypothetical protein